MEAAHIDGGSHEGCTPHTTHTHTISGTHRFGVFFVGFGVAASSGNGKEQTFDALNHGVYPISVSKTIIGKGYRSSATSSMFVRTATPMLSSGKNVSCEASASGGQSQRHKVPPSYHGRHASHLTTVMNHAMTAILSCT